MKDFERRLRKIEDITTVSESEQQPGVMFTIAGEDCKQGVDIPMPVHVHKAKRFKSDIVGMPGIGLIRDCQRCDILNCTARKEPMAQ